MASGMVKGRTRPEDEINSELRKIPFGKSIEDFSAALVMNPGSGLPKGTFATTQKYFYIRNGASMVFTATTGSKQRVVQCRFYIEAGGVLHFGLDKREFVQNRIVVRRGGALIIDEDLGTQNTLFVEEGADIPDLGSLFGSIRTHNVQTAVLNLIKLPPSIEAHPHSAPSAPPGYDHSMQKEKDLAPSGYDRSGADSGKGLKEGGSEMNSNQNVTHSRRPIKSLPLPTRKLIDDFNAALIMNPGSGLPNATTQKYFYIRNGASMVFTAATGSKRRVVQCRFYIEAGGVLHFGLDKMEFVQNRIVVRRGGALIIDEDLGTQNNLFVEEGADIPDLGSLFGSITMYICPTADLDLVKLPPSIEAHPHSAPSAPPGYDHSMQKEKDLAPSGYDRSGADSGNGLKQGASRGRQRSISGSVGRGSVHEVRASPIRVPPVAVAVGATGSDVPVVVAEVLQAAEPSAPSALPSYDRSMQKEKDSAFASPPTAPPAEAPSRAPGGGADARLPRDLPKVLIQGDVMKLNSPGSMSSQLGFLVRHQRWLVIESDMSTGLPRQYFLRYWHSRASYNSGSKPVGELKVLRHMKAVMDAFPGEAGPAHHWSKGWRHILVGLSSKDLAGGNKPNGMLEKLRFQPQMSVEVPDDQWADAVLAPWASAISTAVRACHESGV